MTASLKDIRIRLDQQAERIISGLKDRSRYSLNYGVFDKKFADNLSWFEYRLRAEQSLDSEFGRFEFEDQHPILFKKEDLASPKIKRSRPETFLTNVPIDISHNLIKFYKDILHKICLPGEDLNTYGETAKLDVNNVLCLYERICGIGPYVAEAKLRHDQSLLYIHDGEAKRHKLTNQKREEEVIEKAVEIAGRYEFSNPEVVGWIFRNIINRTLDVEVEYIYQVQKQREEPRTPIGWGQVPNKPAGTSRGFGSQ